MITALPINMEMHRALLSNGFRFTGNTLRRDQYGNKRTLKLGRGVISNYENSWPVCDIAVNRAGDWAVISSLVPPGPHGHAPAEFDRWFYRDSD